VGFIREWFGYPDKDEPTLADTWAAIGHQLGLAVSADEHRVDAIGTVRGRQVAVAIAGRDRPWRIFAGDTSPMRKTIHMYWSSSLRVSCRVPAHLEGYVEFVTPSDFPGWTPNGPLNQGRTVNASPAHLSDVLPESARSWLFDRFSDLRIDVQPDAVVFDVADKGATRRGGWFVGVPMHTHYPGTGYEWPQRAIVGPVWWVNMLCDIADSVERATEPPNWQVC
jgi:hypothetical protein